MENGLVYTRKTTSAAGTQQLGATLAPYLHAGDTIVLTGDLGAGKTQFVQGVAAGLGLSEAVVSPTFNIMVEYKNGALPLYHLDLYRLNQEFELEDIGYYDVIDGDGATLIEWGDRFPDALPLDYIEVSILAEEGDVRRVKVRSVGMHARQLLFVWASDSKSRLSKLT